MLQPGLMSLLQDRGRFGQATLGLTTGGPMDPVAASIANRLLHNDPDATLLEVSFGGLEVQADGELQIAVCGASLPITVDGAERRMWSVFWLKDGQRLSCGFSEVGCRTYLAVRGGFSIDQSFGSTSTVMREGIGGIHGGKLAAGDQLPVGARESTPLLWLPPAHRPVYHQRATLRVVPGYQNQSFPRLEKQRFYAGDYEITAKSDRMGYRLEGPAIRGELQGILSEGIALGAIQVPPDGQPIVLLNDRQTIGGYPKLGCVLSLDCASLAQLRPGNLVNFTPITEHGAHNALHLAHVFESARHFEPAPA